MKNVAEMHGPDRAPAGPGSPARASVAAVIVIVLAALAAYHNTLSLPFVFDDNFVIVGNRTIRHLWPLGDVLATPRDGTGAAGRPLLNLSFALNYAAGGLDVRGYHLVNLVLHAASALLLFGLIRRTLLFPRLAGRFQDKAGPIALTATLAWLVHPLNTESVTCVSQRSELLVAFFYLLTLYGLARSGDAIERRRWSVIAFAACVLGTASKEVMSTVPLIALLFDRTFMAGSFREAWRVRRGLHLSLFSTWLLLGGLLVMMGGSRGDAAGFGLGVSAGSYALKQCEAVLHYLRLSVWPHPLILDYGIDVPQHAREVLPQAIVLVLLLAGTIYALIRRPVLGFLGAWYFIILGPSSSFLPLVTQTMAEHRMYLPVIAVIVLAVIAVDAVFGRRAHWLWSVPLAALAVLTVQRNEHYRTELGLWQDTVARRPLNSRAHLWLGLALMKQGRNDEAVTALLEVQRLDGSNPIACHALGQILAQRGRLDEAIALYEKALLGTTDHAAIHSNLCEALRQLHRLPEAIEHGQVAVRLDPTLAAAQGNLALALADAGRTAEAIPHYVEAVRLDPKLVSAHNNLGVALLNVGRYAEARDHLQAALRLEPNLAAAHNTLGAVYDHMGQRDAAVAEFEIALRLQPDFTAARRNLEAVRPSGNARPLPRP